MDNKVKKTVKIRIDGKPINCYILENDTIFIEDTIKEFFKSNSNDIPIILDITDNSQVIQIKVYKIENVIHNIKTKHLKYLAQIGLVDLIETNKNQIEPKERNLSEFDNLILQAMRYNPH
ncbi:hypothetical protein EZS27_039459 [termite gut metagenome]|uniref:Uncharacterized protein n=1 Tax=termite gut metagenome TaxID=433724 RepID=A0A5J4PJF4_9ZZZZ